MPPNYIFLKPFFFILLILFGFNNRNVCGQRALQANRTEEKIRIDGVMDEADWLITPVTSNFTQTTPNVGEPSLKQTEVRALYDDYYLYVFAKMYDDMDKVSRVLCQRDGFDSNTDYFTFIIDTYNDDQNGFAFGVSSMGVQYDGKLFVNSWFGELDMAWYSEVAFYDDHWTVEMKLPYSAFRFPKVEKQNWGVNFFRNISRHREFSTWNPVSPDFNNELAQCGDLLGVENIPTPFRLSLMPYSSFYAEHQTSNTTSNNWGYTVNGGMDIKYGLNDAFTLDMTLIPDFGQVQFDPEVLNLSPFEIQFIDYRQFFTEGNELFNKSGLFYSRRVGGRPIGYHTVRNQLDSNEVILNNPLNSQLFNASKVSGRNKNGLGIGVFNAISAETNATVFNELTNNRRQIGTAPLTNYNVLVLDQNLKNNSFITLTNTNVMRSGAWRDANLTAIHTRLNNKNNDYFVAGNFNLSQRFESKNVSLGHTYSLSAGKQRGQWNYSAAYTERSDTYDQNELGFLWVNNTRDINLSGAFNIFKPFWKLNRFWVRSTLTYQRLYNPNEYIATFLNTSTGVTDKKFHSYGMSCMSNLTESNDFFEPRSWGKVFIRPANIALRAWLSTNYQKRFAFDLNIINTQFINRQDWSNIDFRVSTRFRLSDKIFLITSYNQEIVFNEEGFALRNLGNNPFPNESLFGKRDKLTSISTIDFRYTVTNRMGITFRLRHYWAKVDYKNYAFLADNGRLNTINFDGKNTQGFSMYNTNYNAFTIDMVFRWVYAPASEVNIVWKNAVFNQNELVNLNYFSNIQDMFERNPLNSLSVRVIYFFDTLYLKKLRKSKN